MKKFIIGLCVGLVVAFLIYIGQNPRNEITSASGVDEFFSEDSQVRDYNKEEELTVHLVGVDQSQRSVTVGIEKPQYKKQAVEYFRDLLDSNGMISYELYIFVGTDQPLEMEPTSETDIEENHSDYSLNLTEEEKSAHYKQYLQIVSEVNVLHPGSSLEVVPMSEFQPEDWVPPIIFRQRAIDRATAEFTVSDDPVE